MMAEKADEQKTERLQIEGMLLLFKMEKMNRRRELIPIKNQMLTKGKRIKDKTKKERRRS